MGTVTTVTDSVSTNIEIHFIIKPCPFGSKNLQNTSMKHEVLSFIKYRHFREVEIVTPHSASRTCDWLWHYRWAVWLTLSTSLFLYLVMYIALDP